MKSYQVRRAGTSSLTLRVIIELTLTRSVSEVCARPEQQNFRCLGRKISYATSAIAIYPIDPSSRGNGEAVYDFIVSGLPINNFPVAHVRRIFQVYERLLKPGGTLTYFEYVFIRQLKIPFVNRRERRRLYRVGRVVGDYIRDYQVRRQKVLINVPPAIVRHLHLKPEGEGKGLKSQRRKVLVGAAG